MKRFNIKLRKAIIKFKFITLGFETYYICFEIPRFRELEQSELDKFNLSKGYYGDESDLECFLSEVESQIDGTTHWSKWKEEPPRQGEFCKCYSDDDETFVWRAMVDDDEYERWYFGIER